MILHSTLSWEIAMKALWRWPLVILTWLCERVGSCQACLTCNNHHEQMCIGKSGPPALLLVDICDQALDKVFLLRKIVGNVLFHESWQAFNSLITVALSNKHDLTYLFLFLTFFFTFNLFLIDWGGSKQVLCFVCMLICKSNFTPGLPPSDYDKFLF